MYIPFDKMKKLREASKTGDERAKKILLMQMNDEDFSHDMDDYFAPRQPEAEAPQPKQADAPAPEQTDDYAGIKDERLAKFLKANGVKEGDPEYEDALNDYYAEFPDAKRESDANLPNEEDDGASIYGDGDEQIPDDDAPAPAAAETHEKDCVDTLIDDEYEAVDGYNKAISEISRMDIGDAVKRGVIADLEGIRKDEYDHIEILKRIKTSIEKKEEKEQVQPAPEAI